MGQRSTKKGWFERTEQPKVSIDWVRVNCKNITEREMMLLEIVNYRKMVRRDHLEIIHAGYRDLSQRTNVINRSINKLFEKMCLDKAKVDNVWMQGSSPVIVALDRAGAILLDIPFRRRFEHEKHRIGTQEMVIRRLPANYVHVHGVNDLEVQTIQMGLDIYAWNLEHDNMKQFHFAGEDYTLIPDVFLITECSDGEPIMFFIEYDTGSEGMQTIYDKLRKYKTYKRIGLWKSEDWVKNVSFKVNFPTILFVTESEQRKKPVRAKALEDGLDLQSLLPSEYSKVLKRLTTR